jgi:hypothetical protein
MAKPAALKSAALHQTSVVAPVTAAFRVSVVGFKKREAPMIRRTRLGPYPGRMLTRCDF